MGGTQNRWFNEWSPIPVQTGGARGKETYMQRFQTRRQRGRVFFVRGPPVPPKPAGVGVPKRSLRVSPRDHEPAQRKLKLKMEKERHEKNEGSDRRRAGFLLMAPAED
jgi:hypothetical protein